LTKIVLLRASSNERTPARHRVIVLLKRVRAKLGRFNASAIDYTTGAWNSDTDEVSAWDVFRSAVPLHALAATTRSHHESHVLALAVSRCR
jgi:hypothetical protein